MIEQLYSNRKALMRRAERLRIAARKLAGNMRGGAFRSLYHSRGIEFDSVREYIAGDDVRNIDWNVTARMDRPFVKCFEEKKELPVFFIVDCSLSMSQLSSHKTKTEYSCETGMLLTMASELNACPLGAVFFDGRIRFSLSPCRGAKSAMQLLNQFENMAFDVKAGSLLKSALSVSGKLLSEHSLVFILSDFRSAGWESAFAPLASKHDVVAIRITDDFDYVLPKCGAVLFRDCESSFRVTLPTSSPSFRSAWKNKEKQRDEKWMSACSSMAGHPLLMSTSDSPEYVLNRFFSSRERFA